MVRETQLAQTTENLHLKYLDICKYNIFLCSLFDPLHLSNIKEVFAVHSFPTCL
jgi:hypothetical protein